MSPKKENSADPVFEEKCQRLQDILVNFAGERHMLEEIIVATDIIRDDLRRMIRLYGRDCMNQAKHAVNLVDRAVDAGIPSTVNMPEQHREICKEKLLHATDNIHALLLQAMKVPSIKKRKKR